MNFLLNRFNERYQKDSTIDIRFFDENPLSIKRIRYNQSGAVCYCMGNQAQGKQKISNVWKPVNCSEDCKYRLSVDDISKPACNVEGTLKFLLPEISTDRIWIMKITGQTSIKRLESYIELQKQLGNSLIGDYTLFLKQEEQTNKQGKTFNNYILDIIQKEDFISKPQNSNIKEIKNTTNQSKLSPKRTQTVDKTSEKIKKDVSNIAKNTNKEVPSKENKKTTTENKGTIETNEKSTVIKNEIVEDTKNIQTPSNINNIYFLIETYTKNFMKDGKPSEYLVADFVDMNDTVTNVIIPPNLSEELLQCDVGTNVILSLETKGDKTFTKTIEYVQKLQKNVAA